MKIIHFNNFDLTKINKLVGSHLGNSKLDNGYVYVDNNFKIFGYCIVTEDDINIKINWIYAKKGHGTEFLQRVERALFKKYSKIILKVSIDPTEQDESVIRRLNFYIKNNYQVFDIKYRKKYGPLLSLYKNK